MNISDSRDDTFDVAIVGYGPTGLALAYWLGKAGHKTVVIERWPDLYALPRAGHVDGEIMRLFQRMGIAETIAGDSSVTGSNVILDSDGVQIAKVSAEESDQGWHAHYSLFQPNLEQALDAKVRDTGHVSVLQGWLAESIERCADGGVQINIASGKESSGNWIPTGLRKVIAARWLIGADGANSVVQKFLQGTTQDLGYNARALVIFAQRLDPTVGATMPDGEVGMMPSRPYIAFRESGKRFARWEFHVHENESSSDMGKESKAWELIGPWGFTPDNSRLIRHSVFEFRSLIVENWRDGNILLAGDAAHRMPPFQGQGMCSGQRDAAALAWRLDLVMRGVTDAAILDSYTGERRSHVLGITENTLERGRLFMLTDPEAARQRDARMREGFATENQKRSYGSVPPLTNGLLMKGTGGVVSPAGRLSAQFTVRHRGQESLLDDYIGAHWHVLAVDKSLLESLAATERELLKRLGALTLFLGRNETRDGFEDVGGNYSRWLSDLGCRLVLIRPDSYIFGGASDANGVRSLFNSLRAQLHLKVELV
ncbi:MAG: bifunctional 3-(3-hydroxy-phenyl)propionate/3-hydroxycinnamic acid hydroxylase [Rhodospirillaceae bacterium]|nr:MAG: bifunctional 3-(3-hydroxy-phenyl)propionate/3-hydroxycinnamic acid hydroxylase [Rhodospirillaceae bacterium]